VGGRRRTADVTLASEGGGARLLVRDVLLRDGATLRLQAPVPSDFEDIRAFTTACRRRAAISGSMATDAPTPSRGQKLRLVVLTAWR